MSNPRKQTFRDSMTWLHTWAGLILGALIFTVFWMGTLSVFDLEIDRWTWPESRLEFVETDIDHDAILARARAAEPGKQLTSVGIVTPFDRMPYVAVYTGYADGGHGHLNIDPRTGAELGEPQSYGGSEFLYPMHIHLFMPGVLGWWLVLIAAFAMLLLLITGVVIHRKIFADFFTFRAQRKLRRSSLDLHNITGTIFLPFHILITLSGIAIFSGWYTSLTWTALPGGGGERVAEMLFEADNYGYYHRDPIGEPGGQTQLAPLISRSEQIWSARRGEPITAGYIELEHIGDDAGFISVRSNLPNRIEAKQDIVIFDQSSGEMIVDYVPSAIVTVQTWLAGFHLMGFDHWLLRWLYFVGGLSGCVLTATGFIFWTASREQKASAQPLNVRFVRAASVGVVTGLILATAAFFVANRVLPEGLTMFGLERASIEVRIFFLVWVLSFAHAALRNAQAWAEQAGAIAITAAAAAVLNWATTGDHIFAAAEKGLWSVSSVDLVLLAGAGVAALTAHTLMRRALRETQQTATATS